MKSSKQLWMLTFCLMNWVLGPDLLVGRDLFISAGANTYNLTLGSTNTIDLDLTVLQTLQTGFGGFQGHTIEFDYEIGLWDATNQIFYPIGDYYLPHVASAFENTAAPIFCDWHFAVPGAPTPCNSWSNDLTLSYGVGCDVPSGSYELQVRMTHSVYTLDIFTSVQTLTTQTYNGQNCFNPISNCIIGNLATVNWTNTSNLNASVTNLTGEQCNLGNGSFSLNISGGTGPYEVEWTSTVASGNDPNVGGPTYTSPSSLPAGTYLITVTDNAGCAVVITNVVIPSVSPAPTVSFVPSDASCGNIDGSVIVSLQNGSPTWTYNLSGPSPGGGMMMPSNFNLTGLIPGAYSFQANDANGCTATGSFTIGVAGSLSVSINPSSLSLCIDQCVSVGATVSGGIGPYSYNWTHTYTSQGNTSITPAGNSEEICFRGINGYTNQTLIVQVTDAYGCTGQATLNSITVRSGRKGCTSPYYNGCCTNPGGQRFAGQYEADELGTSDLFTVSPNPAKDYLLLSYQGSEQLMETWEIELLDVQGRPLLIKSYEAGNASTKLSLQAVPAGLYLLRVTGDGNVLHQSKILKE